MTMKITNHEREAAAVEAIGLDPATVLAGTLVLDNVFGHETLRWSGVKHLSDEESRAFHAALQPPPPIVCAAHRRFIPCRFDNDDCWTTDDPAIVAIVDQYQRSDTKP